MRPLQPRRPVHLLVLIYVVTSSATLAGLVTWAAVELVGSSGSGVGSTEAAIVGSYIVVVASISLILVALGASPSQTINRWLLARRSWLTVLPLAGATALIVYPVVHGIFSSFYAPLGFQPEDIGLDYTAVVQVAAVLAIVLIVVVAIMTVLMIAVLVAATYAVWQGVHATDEVSLSPSLAAMQQIESVVVSVILTPLIGLAWLVTRPRAWRRLFVRSFWQIEDAFRATGWHYLMPGDLKGIPQPTLRHIVASSSDCIQRCLSLFLIAAIPVVALSAADLNSRAAHLAAVVQEGNDVTGVSYYGLEVLPLPASRVSIVWLGSNAPTGVHQRVNRCMYLGTGHGMILLYDVDHGRRIDIPASSAEVIDSGPSSDPCLP